LKIGQILKKVLATVRKFPILSGQSRTARSGVFRVKTKVTWRFNELFTSHNQKMKLLKTSFIAAGTGLLALSAFAGTEAGNLEVEGAASLQFQDQHSSGGGGTQNNTDTLYQGQIGLGYFITDAVELKGNAVFQGSAIRGNGNNNDNYSFFILGGVDYHFFTKEHIVPYVGIYGGVDLGESSGGGTSTTTTGGVVDVHGGMKQFVGERTSIDYRLSYQYISLSGGGFDQTINALVFSVGVTYQF
jgi:hypothetical protein